MLEAEETAQLKRMQQTSISLPPQDFEFIRQNSIDLSRVAAAHIAAERRKLEVAEAFEKRRTSHDPYLMSDTDGIAHM